MQINWDSFIVHNRDSRGVRFKFEDLCRHLFINENLSGNKQFRYLHANPNNPGLETEPILNEKINKRVGFQAKFFEGNPNYGEIKNSAQKIVKYYSDKVELVYIFCNKPLTTSSLSKTINILKTANIELQLITDAAILDLVINKYPYLGLYYFGNQLINHEWFLRNSEYVFDELGERYNRTFNYETLFFVELSLFVHDQRAADYINQKKAFLLREIEKIYGSELRVRQYLRELKSSIEALPDVNTDNLYDSAQWKARVESAVSVYQDPFRKELTELQKEQEKCNKKLNEAKDKIEYDKVLSKLHSLSQDIKRIESLINLPCGIEISEREKQLMLGAVLTVQGRAGTGKTQLLAYKTKQLLSSGRNALLLNAGDYYSTNPIREQIIKNLGFDYSFDELIDVLETIGENGNYIVPLFIDAINETWNRNLWKTELPRIIEKVKRCQMVKLVLSYRTEYEEILLSNAILEMKRKGDVLNMTHRGFEDNSTEAIKEFLNRYGIPFSPLEYFSYEMSNPLFLKLYCETYDGTEVSLPDLYERLISKANTNIHRSLDKELKEKGYDENEDILMPLVLEIAKYLALKDKRTITRAELNELEFWSHYKLAPAVIVRQLIHEHILHEYLYENEDYLYFAYDQMNDYYCAKAIVEEFEGEALRHYLSENILGIKDGQLTKEYNIDLFVNACALYAEKYGSECISIIAELSDGFDKQTVFSRYIDSFQWRNVNHFSANGITELLKQYPCEPENLWKMLIGNSVKVHHPYNADFLHTFLSSYSLNKRDYLWTTYINQLTWEESNRIQQLVQLYNKGEKLEIRDARQVELLLTLFGWILTSSNRWLRDNTSKAMVELLKDYFGFCLPILQKFKDVNDPYVLQRLYGVVFGACCKRKEKNDDEYIKLAEFVYNTVFNQEKVYPDILLRDYARLIVEQFLYEYPNYKGCIDRKNIIPPYNSDPIPDIEDQHYLEQKSDAGIAEVIFSMRFEGMGMYGDFGRYVFQSALHNFEVDDNRIFNYALYHIFNELGYNEEYFGKYDKHCDNYNRDRPRIERIGKKYQWITMYNILARVSDHCKMVDRWTFPQKSDIQFEGAWDINVRDFDPTLNRNFMKCPGTPTFEGIIRFIDESKKENERADVSNQQKSAEWLKDHGVFFEALINTNILQDDKGNDWISLTKYLDTGRKNLAEDKLLVWGWQYAYFAQPFQVEAIKRVINSGETSITGDFDSHHQSYSIFNREYPWSPSCKQFNKSAWLEASIPTGEKKRVTETVQVPDFSYEKWIQKLERELDLGELGDADETVDDEELDIKFEYKEQTIEREIIETIGEVLHASSNFVWEGEYDASEETSISYGAPCAEVIETLKLEQKEFDGFYYDSNGLLAAFDLEKVQGIGGVVIRKDLLDEFLSQTGLKLMWIMQGQKEIHNLDFSIEKWSEWEGFYEYNNGKISGDIRFVQVR